jgi:hypothetical protein
MFFFFLDIRDFVLYSVNNANNFGNKGGVCRGAGDAGASLTDIEHPSTVSTADKRG